MALKSEKTIKLLKNWNVASANYLEFSALFTVCAQNISNVFATFKMYSKHNENKSKWKNK